MFSIVLLLGFCGHGNTVQVRMCANHWCTEPVYRGIAAEDWSNEENPAYLTLKKGGGIVVFGVENDYFDAESGGRRGFLPKDKAIITETLLEPTVQFNPYYKEGASDNEELAEDQESNEEEIEALAAQINVVNTGGEDKDEEQDGGSSDDHNADNDVSKHDDEEAPVENVGPSDLQLEQEVERDEGDRITKLRRDQDKIKHEILERQKIKMKEEIRLRQEEKERNRIEKQRLEEERLENERVEQLRLENERLEGERLEQERMEKEQQDKKEQERQEREQQEMMARDERERRQREEKERLERENQERERKERHVREEQEKLEKERRARELREKEEKERLEMEEREKLAREEQEKKAREEEELERRAREEEEQERRAREAEEQERFTKEELERKVREKEEQESIAREAREKVARQEEERLQRERLEKGRREKERLAKNQLEKQRLEEELVEVEKQKKEEETKQASFLAKKKELEEQYRLRREEKRRNKNLDEATKRPLSNNAKKDTSKLETGTCIGEDCPNLNTNPDKHGSFSSSYHYDHLHSDHPSSDHPPSDDPHSDLSIYSDSGETNEDFDDIGQIPESYQDDTDHSLPSNKDDPAPDISQTSIKTEVTSSNGREDHLKRSQNDRTEEKHDFSSRYESMRRKSQPFYCSLPVLDSLCVSLGSDAAVLIVVATIFGGGLIAFLCIMGPSGSDSPEELRSEKEGGEKPRNKRHPADVDPKVLQKLEEQSNFQQLFAGNLNEVLEKLVALTNNVQDLGTENRQCQLQLQTTQEKLDAASARSLTLESEVNTLQNQLRQQKDYNTGFVELESSLHTKIEDLEEKIATSRDIISTQECTALSTSDQIATLQTQLQTTVAERNTTQEKLQSAISTIEELTGSLEVTRDSLTTTQDLLEQAESDTEAWVVRVQILSLELEDTGSSLSTLQEELEGKSRDVDILRDCLVELREKLDLTEGVDPASHFQDMIDVSSMKQENEKILEANRDVSAELQVVQEQRDLYEERIQEVEEEMEGLRMEKEEEAEKRKEVTTKFEALSTYFKEKEDGLHCRLSELQVKCKQLEEESSEANILFYKEELFRMKKAHAETERNLTLQIQTNERKAKDAFSQLRAKDAKLKESAEIIKKLKKSGGSGIPEDGPAPGPPFLDYPPPSALRKQTNDSPSDCSITSAEELESRRLEKDQHFPPPDLMRPPFDDIGRYGPRPYPEDMYRDGIYAPREYGPPPFDPHGVPLDHPRPRENSRPPSTGRDERMPSREPPFFPRDMIPPRDFPHRDLPPRDLPPRDVPPKELPPRDFAPRDAPPRDLPQYVPREFGPIIPPRDGAPRIPSRDGGAPPVVPNRNTLTRVNSNNNEQPSGVLSHSGSTNSLSMGV